MKKFITLFIVLAIIIAILPANAFADDITNNESQRANQEIADETGTANFDNVTEEDIFVTSEEATYIAQLFVNDTIEAGISTWTYSTEPLSVVTMYDQTNDSDISAYCIEFYVGYVVVSAYLGVDNIILEWSDVAQPLYKSFDDTGENRIIYTGALSYYKEVDNTNMKAVDGTIIAKESVPNLLETAKKIENVPAEILMSISVNKNSPVIRGASTVTDPYADANSKYKGPFKYHSHINNWDNSSSNLRVIDMSAFSGYKNHCAPTAITNMLRMYGNRYNVRAIKSKTDTELFRSVIDKGDGRYFNMDINFFGITIGGTVNAMCGSYIADCFDVYGLRASCIKKNLSFDNMKSSLEKDRLMYIMTVNHSTYGNHAVVGYAYTRLVSTTTGNYKTYIKIADGWSTSPRYADLATLTSYNYWEAKISR